ncbi:MAG: fused MFS/spermidine synthase [Myxococcales bacterium]|nr:fused MFS/spermidine synthase [Myxococcales bacterium]
MRNTHLLGCLVLSGMTGLAYELLWVRLLTLGFGSTTLSFSTVLAVFFGGLAIGSWLGGTWASGAPHPGRIYAKIEFIIGCLSLALYPILHHIDKVFTILDPTHGWNGAGIRILISAPLLLGPTILMGATLPLVTRAVVVTEHRVGTGAATIYGLNTLGAFLGAYLITYYGLFYLGVFICILCSATLNFIAGGIAWVAHSPKTSSNPAPILAQPPSRSNKERNVAITLAFISGFAAICLQVVWVRLFSIFLDGTIYGVGSVLISVLVGIGLGSLWVAQPLRSSMYPHRWFNRLQIIMLIMFYIISMILPWVAYTLRSIPESQNGLTAVHLQLLVVLLTLSIFNIASGASMPLLIAIAKYQVKEAGNAIGSLFASNTTGSIAGSLLAGFILIPQVGTIATLYVGMISIALCSCLSILFFTKENLIYRLSYMVLPLLLMNFWPEMDPLQLSLMGSKTTQGKSYAEFIRGLDRHARSVLWFEEGISASVVVSEDPSGTRSLWLNGLGQGARLGRPPFHVYESLMVALVPLAHIQQPTKVFVVGLGAGVTIDAFLQLNSATIEVAEIEPAVMRAQQAIFHGSPSPISNPKVIVHRGDARLILQTARHHHRGPYDIITSMPAHPWIAANIFTREFFAIAKQNLSKEGVFSTWFGLGRVDQVSLDSLVRAFTSVFDNYLIYHLSEADALYLVGSKGPVKVDVERFAQLRRTPAIHGQAAIRSNFHLAHQVVGSGQQGDPRPEPGPVNSDDSALVEVRTPRMTTVARSLGRFLPYPYLQTDLLIPKDQRSSLAINILEHLLGTPYGVIPIEHQPIRQHLALRTIRGWQALLSDEAQHYFQGRLALHRGDLPQARSHFAFLTSHLSTRAKQFLAVAQQSAPPAAVETLASHTLAALLDTIPHEDIAEHLPLSPPTAQVDPGGWLIWHGLSKTASVTPPNREDFLAAAAEIRNTQHLGLIELARSVALQHRWAQEARVLNTNLVHKRQARARRLLRLSQHSPADQTPQATTLLEQAAVLDPTSEPLLKRFLTKLLESRADTQRIESVARSLQLQGWTANQLRFFINRSVSSSFNKEAPSTNRTDTSTTDSQ